VERAEQAKQIDRVRQLAGRQGLALRRSRVREPQRKGYGEYYLTAAGSTLQVVGSARYRGGLSLEDVEAWLLARERA